MESEEEQEEEAAVDDAGAEDEEEGRDVPPAVDRVLVAQVPRAGDRWHQVGLNEDVVRDFFRMEPNSAQRLLLRHVRAIGVYGDPEIRRITMSFTNRNRRLEIGARRYAEYPTLADPCVP